MTIQVHYHLRKRLDTKHTFHNFFHGYICMYVYIYICISWIHIYFMDVHTHVNIVTPKSSDKPREKIFLITLTCASCYKIVRACCHVHKMLGSLQRQQKWRRPSNTLCEFHVVEMTKNQY